MIKILRFSTRCAVIILFCLLPWLALIDFDFLQGTLFSFKFGPVPFADPATALQTAQSFDSEIVIGALVSLLVALILGRVFCGWLCPYGFFSELVTGWRNKKKYSKKIEKKARLIEHISRVAVLLLAAFCVFLFSFPVLHYLAMPGNLSIAPLLFKLDAGKDSILTPLLAVGTVLAIPLAVLAIELATSSRIWCRFFCPQGLMLGLSAALTEKLPVGLRIGWHSNKCSCRGDMPCRAACSLDLNPRQIDGPRRLDCVMCGACIKACASRGKALSWKWGK